MILLALGLTMNFCAFAAKSVTVCITMSDGGENGYKVITESSSTDGNGNITKSLVCHSPGPSECKFRLKPINNVTDPTNGEVHDIEFTSFQNVVIGAIEQGQTGGTIIITGTNNTLYWHQTEDGYCMIFAQDI